MWIIHELNEGDTNTHTHTRPQLWKCRESTHLAQIIASKMSRQFSSMDIFILQIIYSVASTQKLGINSVSAFFFSVNLFSVCANICVRFHEWHTHAHTHNHAMMLWNQEKLFQIKDVGKKYSSLWKIRPLPTHHFYRPQCTRCAVETVF